MVHQFGPYVEVRRLGAGGFGTVYLAESPDGVRVAVKVLTEQSQSRARSLLAREVEAAHRVDSRHVAQVHDADLGADPPWVAFTARGTRTLTERLHSDGVCDRDALRALRGAALGLSAMHEAGLTHRDVSPDNILITPDGGMMVDLGLATLGTDSTFTRELAGKLAYLAPEQWTTSAARPASDVWQWGVTATRVLSGHLPFPPARNPAEQQHIVSDQVPDLSRVGPARSLLASCLAKSPQARPGAASVASQVQVILETTQFNSRGDFLDVSHKTVLEQEGLAEVTRIEVTARGRLHARAHVREAEGARHVSSQWRGSAGDVDLRVGDLVAIGWDGDETLHVGAHIVALRTGNEASPTLPDKCELCGTRLVPGVDQAINCPNEQYCPALVLPRLAWNLALSRVMRGAPTDSRRRSIVRAVARQLLDGGQIW